MHNWPRRTLRATKAEARRRVGYRKLAKRLEKLDVKDSGRTIANKNSQSGITAVFLVRWLVAVGASSLRLEA